MGKTDAVNTVRAQYQQNSEALLTDALGQAYDFGASDMRATAAEAGGGTLPAEDTTPYSEEDMTEIRSALEAAQSTIASLQEQVAKVTSDDEADKAAIAEATGHATELDGKINRILEILAPAPQA